MAKHIVKCLLCGEQFDANVEPYVKPRANRYAHKKCYEEIMKPRIDLEQYICQLFDYDSLPSIVQKQIDDYVRYNHYTYQGIINALKYFYEVKHGDIAKSNGRIGIVPYVYEEAIQYNLSLMETHEKLQETKQLVLDIPVIEVRIKNPERKPMKIKNDFSFLDEGSENI